MSRKKALFIFLIIFSISLVFLIITLIKDRTSLIGYGLFGAFFVVSLVFLFLYATNDNITKYRKIELENFIKNHPELNVRNFEINNQNAYIELDRNGSLVYISIFNKRAYMDIFSKDEAKKIEYLEQLEDESLKREGFLNLMKDKKGIKLLIKNLSADEIFYKIMQRLN